MQHIKTLAYQFLLESRFTDLNVTPDALQKTLKKQDIILLSYSEWEAIKARFPFDVHTNIEIAMTKNNSISIMHKSCAFILYANNLSLSKTIYTIFHEIGHIKAQHKRANYYNFEINEEQEREADAFAQYAIAPPCVINEIGGTPENLIPIISAIKENTIQNILHKSKNSLTAVEKELIQLYQPYIIANKIKNPIEKQIKVIIASLIIVTWILLLFLGIKNIPDQQQSVIVPTQTQEKTNTRAVSENEVVWKSKTGDIYHTDSKCYHITKTAYKLNLDDAISAGFRKCKDCKK